jgi:hypothetical protein
MRDFDSLLLPVDVEGFLILLSFRRMTTFASSKYSRMRLLASFMQHSLRQEELRRGLPSAVGIRDVLSVEQSISLPERMHHLFLD